MAWTDSCIALDAPIIPRLRDGIKASLVLMNGSEDRREAVAKAVTRSLIAPLAR
jgi:hypothetical protein